MQQEDKIKHLILFGLINLVVSIVSGASGGAGAIVTTPLMVLLGLTPAQAIATAKFNGLGIAVGASSRFFKEKLADRRTVIVFSIIGAIMAVLGSLVLAHFRNETELLQKIMGVVILFVGIPLLYVRRWGLHAAERPTWIKAVGFVLLAFGVFLQTALGSGIASLQMVILIIFFGMPALTASATRRAMQLTVAIVSLAIYGVVGLIDYKFGLVGLATSTVGGFIGAHIALKKGNKFVVNLFAAISALLALELIFGG